MVVSSQVQALALPDNLPFRVISRTIGSGAYAFIRRACPLHAYQPVIAVKFIHKEHAYKLGRVKPKQIQAEVALHSHVGRHQNIIQFLSSGEDQIWTWIAMELAEGGDLFDKIEPDRGVTEDIAHFYFTQLVSAVSYMHSREVAHRDIKPENILLSDGDLKLADFGLAVLYGHNGKKKLCQTVCGSPPYMAPEVVPKGGFTGHKTDPYEGNLADIWSCGIVLFVLLVGNTPWDQPTDDSPEFYDYYHYGKLDELWSQVPHEAMSLLKGILCVDPKNRFRLDNIRRHPWFTRPNPHLRSDGRAANPLSLATQMLQSLRIDFDADPFAAAGPRSSSSGNADANADSSMDVDGHAGLGRFAFSQPETPVAEATFDWEQPARMAANEGVSASQPTGGIHNQSSGGGIIPEGFMHDPSMSQFSATPGVPLSITQAARRFRDIIPDHSLSKFLSFMDFSLLLPLISEALSRLGIQVPPPTTQDLLGAGREQKAFISVKTRDQRNCQLVGTVTVERLGEEVFEVRFLKAKGDPLEWRRLFKKVAVLCQDAILKPE